MNLLHARHGHTSTPDKYENNISTTKFPPTPARTNFNLTRAPHSLLQNLNRYVVKRCALCSGKIKVIIAFNLIFISWCLCLWYNFGNFKLMQKAIMENDYMISKKVTDLPSCVDKWNHTFKLEHAGFVPFQHGTKPLPPFTSGDPPICRLSSSTISPIPVILVSKGRSASSSTWQVMSRLTGHCFKCREYTGMNSTLQQKFFSSIKPGENGNWILGYLCAQQIAYKNKGGIIGFKWKPFNREINNVAEDGFDGLRMIAHHTNPQIKIVSSGRNHLDVLVSQTKHMKMRGKDGGAYAHCSQENTECLNAHKKFGSGIHMPLGSLLSKLRYLATLEKIFEKNLQMLNVPHIKVTYEKLYQSKDAEEWMRIFRFIGRGPGYDLSMDQVEKAMEHVGTSVPFHNVSISNYNEVRDILRGTEFEALLH